MALPVVGARPPDYPGRRRVRRAADAAVKVVRAAKPGGKVEFRVRRDGKEIGVTVTVTVGVFPLHRTLGLE